MVQSGARGTVPGEKQNKTSSYQILFDYLIISQRLTENQVMQLNVWHIDEQRHTLGRDKMGQVHMHTHTYTHIHTLL